MTPIGDDLDDVAAAALGVPVFTALMCLERAQQAGASLDGAHVLVVGATGAVGSIAVQLAKLMGAARVVAAGRNRERLERALALGADATVELGDGVDADELRDALLRRRGRPSRRGARPALGRARPRRDRRAHARRRVRELRAGGIAGRRAVGHPAAQPPGHARGPLGRLGDAAGAPGRARARSRAGERGRRRTDARHRGARARRDRRRLGAAHRVRRAAAWWCRL